ncbi:MAG TPA: RibD family protein [Hyphomicrobium sp.]|nr:RibD family protein [Hyphomicrobium sp.]
MTARTINTTLVHLNAAQASAADDLLAPLIHAPPGRPYVIAQLGQSLDGRIATPTGASRWINSAAALDHLHRLRSHVDAVVVGIGTVVADDPLLTVRRVAGRHPARVVIDPNGRLISSARMLADDGVRRVIICGADRAVPAVAESIVVGRAIDGQFDPNDIVAALYTAGFKKILIEGGASTVSSFIDANAVDRLHVLVAPIILGSGMMGLSLKAITRLEEAHRPATSVHVLDDGDVLFDCNLRSRI